MHIEVTSDAVEAMRRAAEQQHPLEACGILLGEGNRIISFGQTRNVHPEPERHFEIDPQALIDAHRDARGGGLQVIGYFHSHPDRPSHPSAKDREMASGDGRIWAITGKEEIKFWQDGRGGFSALSYQIIQS